MKLEGPVAGVAEQCERVLRTLPGWFGIEASLVQYVRDTATLPTFVAIDGAEVVGFVTLREHFPESWEVHCIAIQASHRRRGVGRALHSHVEAWLVSRGAHLLQVKTMAESCPSPEYAQTRRFYASIGYTPLETFPTLWGPKLPVLQLLKILPQR